VFQKLRIPKRPNVGFYVYRMREAKSKKVRSSEKKIIILSWAAICG
jgi:hypothetical protein